MGKILESIGIIDGYDITIIGKFKVRKDHLFDDIEKCDPNLLEEVRKLVHSSGKVFAIVKKGKIAGIYLFEEEIQENARNLKHIKTVYTDEVAEDTREKYELHILNLAKEYVSMQQYDKVTLEDQVVQVDSTKTKKGSIIALVGGFMIGFLLGFTVFDDIVLGFLYGLIFAPTFGGLEVVITKKRGRKKKKS